MVTETTLAEAGQRAAAGFLETVVVIDDRAFEGSRLGVELERTADGPTVRRRDRTLNTPTTRQEHELNARELVAAFAARGLVCGLLSPEPDATGDVPMAAVRKADIVVLDWNVYDDVGDGALHIIESLWDEGDVLHRLRLVAVYTGDRELDLIVGKIVALLRTLDPSPVRREGRFVCSKDMLRVAVFAKPNTVFQANERAKLARRVVESDLPRRLIDEFAKLTQGLVPCVALMSLAAVRQNTHRIATRLNRGLDPAYLWHRAMLTNPVEAEQTLVDLVAAELQSVLENDEPGRGANLDAIRLWLKDQDLSKLGTQFGSTGPLNEDDVLAVLQLGALHENAQGEWLGSKLGLTKGGLAKKKIAGFARSTAEAERNDAAFAHLLGLKTRYSNPAPKLSLGVVVASGQGASERYWLCLQPRCDSIRLPGPTSFAMLPLDPARDGKRFDIVISSPNKIMRLELRRKPADLRMIKFPPMPGCDSVVAHATSGGRYRFRAETNRPAWYRFVAELKPDSAQLIANEFGYRISHVGLNESEWLRRWRSAS